MKVGTTSTEVNVEAGVNTVQTESGSVGQLITQEQVKSIQLNGRNPIYLSQLEPGVVRSNSMAAFAFGLDNGINVNGARSPGERADLRWRADGAHPLQRHQRRRGRRGLDLAGAGADHQLSG